MPGYLTSYLAGDADDVTDLAGPTDSPTPEAPPQDMVVLPGGISMPKKTFWLLVVALSVAIYLVIKKKKKQED